MKHRKMSISSLHPTTTPNYRKKTRGEKGSKFVSIDEITKSYQYQKRYFTENKCNKQVMRYHFMKKFQEFSFYTMKYMVLLKEY